MSEVVTPAAPAAAPATPAPAATPPAADVPEPKPDRTFTQAELDEIVEKRLAKEKRKRTEVETRLKVTEELALRRSEREKEETPQPKAQTEGEPTRDQFASYEEFIEARAEWRADQKVNKRFEERDAKDRERTAQTQQEKQREEFRKTMKESAKDIADFEEVLGDIKATDPVGRIDANAIEAAEAPGKVLYHLAKNPDEAERIASLSPGKQAREIVRLEEKLAKPPVKPSKAPDPIEPVGGKGAASGDEMPDPKTQPEKWLAWRTKQVAGQKKAVRAS